MSTSMRVLPAGHLDVDAGAARVEGVLQEFLDDAGRPLHDLAGGDLVDEGGRQLLDAGHAAPG